MDTSSKSPSFISSYVRGEITLGGLRFVSRGIVALNGLIILTNLDLFRYGTYILLFTLYALITSVLFKLLDGPIFNDIMRYIGKGEEASAKKLFLEITALRTVLTILAFVGVWLGSGVMEYFYDKDIALLMRIMSLLLVSDLVYILFYMVSRARLRFGLSYLRPLFLNIIKFFLLIALLLFSSISLTTVLWAHVIAAFVSVVVLIPVFVHVYAPWRSILATKRSLLWLIVKTYGKWQLASQFLGEITANIRPWLIKFFINTEAVAVYSVAESLIGALKMFIPTGTLSTLIPMEIKNKQKSEHIFVRGTKYIFVLGTLLAVAGAIGVPLIVYLFIPKYIVSLPFFWALLVVVPFSSIRGLTNKFLVALRRQKFLFFVAIVKVGGGIVLPVTLLYFFGLWGMVFERLILLFVLGALTFGYLWTREIGHDSRKLLFVFDATDRKIIKQVWQKILASRKHVFKYLRLSS